MIRNIILALIATSIIIVVNLNSATIHFPILITFACAIALGYLQPQKGWISILMLIGSIFIGFFFVKMIGFKPFNNSVFQFVTYIFPLPCLFGGFMGSFFNKAINQNDNRRSPKNRR